MSTSAIATAPATPGEPAASPSSSGAFAALGVREFRFFWIGMVVSLVGTMLHQTALNWLVWRLTHSALLLGLVGFAGNLPVLLFGLFAGTLIDRYDRRQLVMLAQIADMLLAFGCAWLTWAGIIRIEHILAIAFAGGLLHVVEVPARQTFLMDLVGRRHLMSAIALNSAAFNAARVFGPALAAVFLATISEAGCFFLNGLSFLALIAALAAIRPASGAAAHASRVAPEGGALDGLRFIAAHPGMRNLLLMVVTANLFAVPYHQMLPMFIEHELHGGARELGVFSACFGLGAMTGGLFAASRDRTGLSPRLAGRAAQFFCGALFLMACFPGHLLGMALALVMGLAMVTQMATTNNYLQCHAPDGLRGRIVACYTTTVIGCFPIGCLLMGFLADRLGVRAALGLGGLIGLTNALLMFPRLSDSPGQKGCLRR